MSENRSLYKIAPEYLAVLDKLENIEDPEKELNKELWLIFSEVKGELTKKLESYAYIIKRMDHEADFLDTEINRLKKRRDLRRSKVDWLKNNIKEFLLNLEKPKIETPSVTLRVQNNAPSVEEKDISSIPSEYKEIIISTNVKKKEILAHIKNTGEIVPGVEIRQGNHLRIT